MFNKNQFKSLKSRMSFGGDDLFNVFESSNQTNGFEAQKRKANEEQPVIIEEKKSKQEDDGK